MNRRWRGGRPRHLKGLAPLLLFLLLLIFLPASLLCQLYSTCIPIGEGRRDGIMTCRCKLIVPIMRFIVILFEEDEGRGGKELLLHSCCTRIVFILYSRLTRRKGGETELGLHDYGVPMSLQLYSHWRKKGVGTEILLHPYCIHTVTLLYSDWRRR